MKNLYQIIENEEGNIIIYDNEKCKIVNGLVITIKPLYVILFILFCIALFYIAK